MQIQSEIEKLLSEVEQDPKSPLRQNQLGNAYFKERKFEEARRCYIKAVELNPNVPVYYENIGLASDELGDWKGSVEAYEKAASRLMIFGTSLLGCSPNCKAFSCQIAI